MVFFAPCLVNLGWFIYCWLYHNWDDARQSNGTSGMFETTNQHQVGPKTIIELVYNFKTKNIELYQFHGVDKPT